MKYLIITIIAFVTTYLAFAYVKGEFNFLLWEQGVRAIQLYATLCFSILGSLINGLADTLN
jgi:hypothetical protein